MFFDDARARRAWLSLFAALVLLVGTPGWAAPASLDDDTVRQYHIPAGPLGRSLARFASESGIALSFQPALAEGLRSQAVNGRFSARQVARRLLADSDLEMVPGASGSGSYTLRKRERTHALPEVTVNGGWSVNGASEGTGLYVTRDNSSATRLNLSNRETPQSVTTITRQRMDDQGLTQLEDVIRQTPGLTIAQGGNAGSDSSPIYSRGFSVENYLVDGVQQVNSNYSSIFQSNDMAIYDRVEIVRGANGLMNGIGAPGASINLIRKRPTYEPRVAIKAEGGSWDYRRGELDVSGPLNSSGSVRGRVVGAYQDNDSYIDRLHQRKKTFYAILEADLTVATRATLGFTLQDHNATGHARGGLPAYYADGGRTDWSRSDSAAADWAYSKRRFQSVFASLEHWFDNDWRVKGTISQDHNEFDEQLGYASGGNPDRASGAGVQLWAGRWAAEPEQKSVDLYASGPFQWLGREHQLVLGASASRTRYDDHTYPLWRFDDWDPFIDNIYTWDGATPGEPPLPATGEYSANERLSSAYATVRFKPLDDLAVLVGARVTDWRNDKTTITYATDTDPRGTARDNRAETGEVTPYLGLIYDLDRHWSAYLSYTSIFKPQSLRDVDGNYIDPLLGNSYEGGVKGEFMDGRLTLGGAVYRIQQDNLGVALVGELAPDGSQAYRAESGTETRGFEVELNGLLTERWQASFGFSRNLVEDSDGGSLNTQIPRNTLKMFSSYRFPQVGQGLTLGAGVRWQSEIHSDNQGPNGARFTQGGYTVVDAMARYALTRQLAATLNLYNLTDKEYYATTGNAYYGEPLSVRLGVEARF